MDFIHTLQEEHKTIHEIFGEIEAADSLENKKNLLKKLLTVIIPHLKKEDEQLYPALEKSPDEEVRRMANVFALTMLEYSNNFKVVSEEIMAASGEIDPDVFAHYEKIRDRIEDRITIEEVTIFPAYKKLVN